MNATVLMDRQAIRGLIARSVDENEGQAILLGMVEPGSQFGKLGATYVVPAIVLLDMMQPPSWWRRVWMMLRGWR